MSETTPPIEWHFRPDAARAIAIDRRMRGELASSLEYLLQQSSAEVDVNVDAVTRVIERMRSDHAYEPRAFATYYRLAEALIDERRDDAAELFEQIASFEPLSTRQAFFALSGDDNDPNRQTFLSLMAEDSDNLGLREANPAKAEPFEKRFKEALGIMRNIMPELAGEFDALIRQVVWISSDPSKSMQIDGGSHYQLWGALFINVDFYETLHDIIEVIAHESAHSLLFGFCIDEPLLHNDDDELYSSPLRRDPRPMDGIYHATWVSARMHWSMVQLLNSGLCTPEQQEKVRAAIASNEKNFNDGHRTVAEHAELTETGRELMKGARSYMDSYQRAHQ